MQVVPASKHRPIGWCPLVLSAASRVWSVPLDGFTNALTWPVLYELGHQSPWYKAPLFMCLGISRLNSHLLVANKFRQIVPICKILGRRTSALRCRCRRHTHFAACALALSTYAGHHDEQESRVADLLLFEPGFPLWRWSAWPIPTRRESFAGWKHRGLHW